MKAMWGILLAAGLAGCTSVSDIEQSHETMDVISGKEPKAYAQCLATKLQESRGELTIEPMGHGYRVVVPQKLASGPAAVVLVDERSGGSSIKVHERLSNLPVRFGDVRQAATDCISG